MFATLLQEWMVANPHRIDLFKLPGVTATSYVVDLMHAKHMGTDKYYYGSVLFLLVYVMLPGTPELNLQTVWNECKLWYKNHPHHARSAFGRIVLSMITNTAAPHETFPALKGRAAEVRHLGPALLHVWNLHRHRDGRDRSIHTTIYMGLQMSVKMETILDEHPRAIKLPVAAADDFANATFDYLACFTAAADWFCFSAPLGQRRKLFSITIKAHYVAHAALQARFINPRLGWCYAGEDYMAKCKHLMAACVRGNNASKASEKFAQKYRLGMHFVLSTADTALFQR